MSLLRRAFLVATVLLGTTTVGHATRPSPFANQSKPMSAMVRILALSSSSRQSFAGNQEIYLAAVTVKKETPEYARLIDQYPGYGLPIRTSLLKAGTSFRMQVTREPECDVPGAEVYLAPGSGVTFDGSIRTYLAEHRGDTIPCYRTIHQSIELTKK
jgi:hypothetical protein